jgi:hypothetical protein
LAPAPLARQIQAETKTLRTSGIAGKVNKKQARSTSLTSCRELLFTKSKIEFLPMETTSRVCKIKCPVSLFSMLWPLGSKFPTALLPYNVSIWQMCGLKFHHKPPVGVKALL